MSVDSGSTTTVRPPRSETENEAFSDPEDDTYIDVPDDVYMLPAEYHKCLQQCIRDVTLPTWVGRLPANLGEASHGKLRVYDYLVLFSFIFPLVVPEFWWAPRRIRRGSSTSSEFPSACRLYKHCLLIQDFKSGCR